MGRSLFLESVAGVAGDMFSAAFVDAGLVTVAELNEQAKRLGLDGVNVVAESVTRATVRAVHVEVKWQDESWKHNFSSQHRHDGHSHTHDPHHGHQHGHDHALHSGHDHPEHDNTNLVLGEDVATHWHTHYSDIDELVRASSLDEKTKELAGRIFRAIAEAEADAHGIAIEEVAFHEVGTIDSIMDVVMAAYCLSKIDADQVFATPIKTGRGNVKIQHGTHPIPPPASIRLLQGMPIAQTPEAIMRENVELSTPTGIAILKVLSPQFIAEMPSGTLLQQGMGAGTMDLGNYPNVFRVSLLETADEAADLPYETDTVVEIVCNIDDDTGEHLAWMSERLMQEGAIDVWQTTATGKKGRVVVCLSVLAAESTWTKFADWILRNSTTFGVRFRKWDRLKLAREFEHRETGDGLLTYKLGYTTDRVKLKEKPEFDETRASLDQT